MSKNLPLTQGIHHVGLTVLDIEKTKQFFIDTLDFEQVGAIPDYPAVILSDGTTRFSLWQVQNPSDASPFDRKHVVGLHHMALGVKPETLDLLHFKLLKTKDVVIEFAPELLGSDPTRHMIFSIPGGIRMELIAPVV